VSVWCTWTEAETRLSIFMTFRRTAQRLWSLYYTGLDIMIFCTRSNSDIAFLQRNYFLSIERIEMEVFCRIFIYIKNGLYRFVNKIKCVLFENFDVVSILYFRLQTTHHPFSANARLPIWAFNANTKITGGQFFNRSVKYKVL